MHTCYYLNHKSLEKNFKIVRCHNIEHEYYNKLSEHSSKTKKIYFLQEAYRLKKYEAVLENAQVLLSISDDDQSYFESSYSKTECIKVPAFHTDNKVSSVLGNGTYSLFHGSLNVSENDHSAQYLVEEIFNDIDYKLVIAGKNPSFKLQKLCAKKDNITLVNDLEWDELNTLIKNAHIHLMHASQKSGLKLKLLKALFLGRHVIANEDMANEKLISDHVVIANDTASWKKAIANLMNIPFDQEILSKRIRVMEEFKNEKIVGKIIEQLKQ
ncbi:MAG: glycosyltransferase [Nonlabens sp.]